MNLLLVATLVACCMTQVANCAVSISIVNEHPDHPNQCYDERLEEFFDVGDIWKPRSYCSKSQCFSTESDVEGSPKKFRIESETCNHVSSWPKNCKLTNPSQNAIYPFCCPILDCDGEPEGPVSAVG